MIVLNNLSDLATKYDNRLLNENLYVYEGLLFQVSDCKINVVNIFASLNTLAAPIEKVMENNCICDDNSDSFVLFATWNMEAIHAFHAATKDMYIDPNDGSGDWD